MDQLAVVASVQQREQAHRLTVEKADNLQVLIGEVVERLQSQRGSRWRLGGGDQGN